MDFSQEFQTITVESNRNSDWVFLSDWILALVLSLAMLFHFNRLFGFLVTELMRMVLWKRHGESVSVESVKISLLGGRIFVKNLTLINKDATVSILRANFTWRYWLRQIRLSEFSFHTDANDDQEQKSALENNKLPSRFTLEIDGLEIFWYNRTDAFENVLDILTKNSDGLSDDEYNSSDGGLRNRKNHSSSTATPMTTGEKTVELGKESSAESTLSFLLKFVPIDFSVKKGASVFGNETTPVITVISYSSANGVFDVAVSPSKLDIYRHNLTANFTALTVTMKQNLSYKGPVNANIQRRFTRAASISNSHDSRFKTWNKFNSFLKKIPKIIRLRTKSEAEKISFQQWKGLREYIDPSDNFDEYDAEQDYNKFSVLLDAEFLYLKYFYDIPGKVPKLVQATNPFDGPDVGNSGPPPLTGLDINLSHSTIHYGPWAEKQRVFVHNMFFPMLCRDSTAQEPLNSGDMRIYTSFKVSLDVADEAIFRMPTREPSKDIAFMKEHKENNLEVMNRPFGWLEVKLSKGSIVNCEVAYTPTHSGWENKLEVLFMKPEIRSSVNHDILFKADRHQISADIGYPLKWNGATSWVFQNHSHNAKLFILREHVTLMSDLFTDFSSGMPTPYELFRPFHYVIDWKLTNYGIFLNVNDSNIINNPVDFNDNTFLSFQGDMLNINVQIPFDSIYTKSNTISFKLSTPYFDFILDTPPWHTANGFLKSKKCGRSNHFTLDGSYTYFSNIELSAADVITLDCVADDITLKTYGFLVRYIMQIRENYFGPDIHFKTLEEFTNLEKDESAKNSISDLYQGHNHNDKSGPSKILKTENESDVYISFCARNGCLVLPYHLYDCESHVALNFLTLDIDVRFTNYYMDLQANFSPIRFKFRENCDDDQLFDLTTHKEKSEPDMFIDGLAIHAHRMFGLPPIEPTYFCKWDFTAGMITANTHTSYLNGLVSCIKNIGYGFKDAENVLMIEIPTLYDITCVTFLTPGISLKIKNENLGSSFSADLLDLSFKFNDIPNLRYSDRISVDISSIEIRMFEGDDDIPVAGLRTTLSASNFCQKQDFDEYNRSQQSHIRTHDAPFHRLPFLIFEDNRDEVYMESFGSMKPSFSIPDVSIPLNRETLDYVYRHFRESEDSETLLSDISDMSTIDLEPLYEDATFKNEYFEFLPSSNLAKETTKSPQKSKGRSPSNMPSFCFYDDADFKPQTPIEKNFEYDNLIFQISSVSCYGTPTSLKAILDTFKSFKDYSVEHLMDELQIDVIDKLREQLLDKSTILNIRYVCPNANFKFGEFEGMEFDEVFSSDTSVPKHINLDIVGPSAAIQLKKTKAMVDTYHNTKTLKTSTESSIAIHLESLAVSLNKNSDSYDSQPLRITIDDLELWTVNGDDKESLSSVTLRSFDTSLQSEELRWMGQYIDTLTEVFENFGKDLHSVILSSSKCESELLYQLSKDSVVYNIEHDPSVLTKPAYILRSSNQHIRANDSWKVMVRLRHVLNSLPAQWHQETNKCFKDQNWRAPSTALQDVLAVFSEWRSWEFSDIEHSYIFRHVFHLNSVTDASPQLTSRVQFMVENFGISLRSKIQEDDYICFDYLDIGISFARDERRFNIGSLDLGDLTGAHEIQIDLSLSSYRSKLSYLIVKLKDLVDVLSSNEESTPLSKTIDDSAGNKSNGKFLLRFTIAVENIQQVLQFQKSQSSMTGSGLALSFFGAYTGNTQDTLPISLVSSLGNFSNNVSYNSIPIFSSKLNNGALVIASLGLNGSKPQLVECTSELMSFSADAGTSTYVHFMKSIMEDEISIIKPLIEELKEKMGNDSTNIEEKSTSSFDLLQALGNVHVKIDTHEARWSTRALSPVTLHGSVLGASCLISAIDGVIFSSFDVKSVKGSIDISNKSVLKVESISNEYSFELFADEQKSMIKSSVNIKSCKFIIPQAEESLHIVLVSLAELQRNVGEFIKVSEEFKSSIDCKEHTVVDLPKEDSKPVLYIIKFGIEYIGLAAFMGGSRLSFDTKEVGFSVFNFANSSSEDNTVVQVPVYGEIVLPTTRITLFDESIPNELSNILNVNFAVKIVNPEVVSESRRQSLQIESQFCRVCMNPYSLVRIVKLVDRMVFIMQKFSKDEDKLTPPKNPMAAADIETGSYDTVETILSFYAIHVLCYNFCVGWVFGTPGDFPGLITGCERVFSVYEKGFGKLTIMEAYLSVANSSRSSNFFSTRSERDSSNRAYLPNMQMMFTSLTESDSRDVNAKITGEELDVKFSSTSLVLFEKTFKSITMMRDFLESRHRPPVNRRSSTFEDSSVEYLSKKFTSIECIACFAGGNFLLYRPEKDVGAGPALFLHSPAVSISSFYSHDPLSKGKKHTLKTEIQTSESDNTLYSTCVPVLVDIYNSIKAMMRESSREKPAPVVKQIKDSADPFSDLQVNKVLSDIDLQVGLKIERQVLALSCEPTAKVQALVGIEGVYIRLSTCPADVHPKLMTGIQLKGITASLQHIYSREVSGSIDVEDIFLSFAVSFADAMEVSSSGFISTVKTYVNLKQYQDLDLFKDIWMPHEFYEDEFDSRSASVTTIANKNLASRVREVSSTTAVPWLITFTLLDVALKVDLGSSLGIITLSLDRFWAVSKKSINWDQSLRLGFDSIILSSEGRLGGYLAAKNMRLHTAISWKLHDNTFDIPLVLVAGGVESLQMRASFDFHVFIVSKIHALSFRVFNQRNFDDILRDRLVVSAKCDSIVATFTALAASNMLDVYNTVMRMFQDSKNSYKEVLRDSSNVGGLDTSVEETSLFHSLSKLRTEIDVDIGKTLIQVYPTTLSDSQVLQICLAGASSNFSQNTIDESLENKLNLKLNNFSLALSSIKTQFSESTINNCEVSTFITHCEEAKGGTIFIFPSLSVTMNTFQKRYQNVVQFFFHSSFGGKVDVRWNLGSVNFIREMWATHEKAYSARTLSKFRTDVLFDDQNEKVEEGNLDEFITNRLEEVKKKSKYVYVPITTPIIEAPQLKDLGDATPPLEWFGLHRKSFPDATHQVVIVGLQKMVREVENQYTKILGKA